MVDVLTREQRKKNMSHIRGKNTRAEIILRKALSAEGVRYRLHLAVPGKPDLAITKHKIAVFVDGCFWHRCSRHYTPPATRSLFWERKISSNVERDRRVNQELRKRGWRVIRIWEHQMQKNPSAAVRRIKRFLNRSQSRQH